MRATTFAVAIACLAMGCQATAVQGASHRHGAKQSAADKAAKGSQKKEAAEPEGFKSICIGCGAK